MLHIMLQNKIDFYIIDFFLTHKPDRVIDVNEIGNAAIVIAPENCEAVNPTSTVNPIQRCIENDENSSKKFIFLFY